MCDVREVKVYMTSSSHISKKQSLTRDVIALPVIGPQVDKDHLDKMVQGHCEAVQCHCLGGTHYRPTCGRRVLVKLKPTRSCLEAKGKMSGTVSTLVQLSFCAAPAAWGEVWTLSQSVC